MKNYTDNLKDEIGYTLIGEYLKGAGYVNKKVSSKDLGMMVCESKFVPSTDNTLVHADRYDSPAISCGVLSNMISTINERIDTYYESLENNLGYGNLEKKEGMLAKYSNNLLKGSIPIAFKEGEEDDDLKTDIKVLLRQSKEEFEKRIEENKDDEKEVRDTTENPEDDNVDTDENEEPSNDAPDDDDIYDPSKDDELDDNEIDEDSDEDDNESDDEEEDDDEDDIYDPSKDDELDNDESNEEDESEDEDEEKDGLFSESFNRYAEERKYKIYNEKTSLSKNELKMLSESLLEIENKGFAALSESFDLNDIADGNSLQNAHRDYIQLNASVNIFKYKLFK